MSAINAGDRFRLPSGNVVEVLPGRVDMGEYRCKYVQISPRPFLGEGVGLPHARGGVSVLAPLWARC